MSWFKNVGHVPPTLLTLDNWRIWNSDSRWVADEIIKAWDAEGLPYPRANGCARCGSKQKTHCTHFGSTGMCALCESCWGELGTAEARRPYYRSLWFRWEMPARYAGVPFGSHSIGEPPFSRGYTRTPWGEIEAALLLEEAGLSVT